MKGTERGNVSSTLDEKVAVNKRLKYQELGPFEKLRFSRCVMSRDGPQWSTTPGFRITERTESTLSNLKATVSGRFDRNRLSSNKQS